MFFCQVTVGTNPLSVAAPGKDGNSFVLDMATSAVALGKVSDQINACSSRQVLFVISIKKFICYKEIGIFCNQLSVFYNQLGVWF